MIRLIVLMLSCMSVLTAGHIPAFANARIMKVEPLTQGDLNKLPPGAAIWFHKNGKYWFYLPIGGAGYMKIDRHLWRFERIGPTYGRWKCGPMKFRQPNSGVGQVQIVQINRRWTLRLQAGRQTYVVTGLTCSSGD